MNPAQDLLPKLMFRSQDERQGYQRLIDFPALDVFVTIANRLISQY
jgi:hypothetical protein